MKLLERLRAMGPAVWLFLLYQNNSEYAGDPVWAPVGMGSAVTDVHVASVLKISASTAVRWRRRLERISIIKTQACRGGGFKVWLRHSDVPSTQPSVQAPEQWPDMLSTALQ